MYLNWGKYQTQNYYAYCYNIKRAAEFGVCKTTISNNYSPRLQNQVKIDFGFCGSSCETPNMMNLYKHDFPQFEKYNRHQWKMEAIYHEDYANKEGIKKDAQLTTTKRPLGR